MKLLLCFPIITDNSVLIKNGHINKIFVFNGGHYVAVFLLGRFGSLPKLAAAGKK